jgi:hypothetical protein
VLFEKIGHNTTSFEDIIANLNEIIAETLTTTYSMLIALQCYEAMTISAEAMSNNAEIKATENYIDTCKKVNKIILSSNPALPDVS